MIIKSIHIVRFHGFKDVGFELGQNLTIIAGQNGTQKTTLLGLLSQPFSLKNHPQMSGEKPLCGGNFFSQFSEKFKLSPRFDKKGEHEWTIQTKYENEPFTICSMYRHSAKSKAIRFWKKKRDKGSGYLHYPVIYLSLKRLFPIGEDAHLRENNKLNITEEEKALFKQLHNQILISQDEITNTDILVSSNKTTLGVSTNQYDWTQNSAGQDNVGKIILALLSFKRLKEKFPKLYKGGLLVIDELDATMYPGSQRKLLNILREYSTRYKIQIVFTTHSLALLELGYELYEKTKSNVRTANQIQLIYLQKQDKNIVIEQGISYPAIVNRLKASIEPKKAFQLQVYSEDPETVAFTKSLLQGYVKKLQFNNQKYSCSQLVDLVQRSVPTFCFPDSIIILDGDVRTMEPTLSEIEKIKKKNFLILPSEQSPERLLATFLFNLSDADRFWKSVHPDYSKQICFDNFTLDKILNKRDVAKNWFQSQNSQFQRWSTKAFNRWKIYSEENIEAANVFVEEFVVLYNKVAEILRIDKIAHTKQQQSVCQHSIRH